MSGPLKVGFIPSSRGMFDQRLATGVRDACIDAMRGAGLDVVAPGSQVSASGLITGTADAGRAARLFADEGVDGLIIGALNFGDETSAAVAASPPAHPLPVMLFGLGEEGVLTRQTARRDSFCGLISIATALRHRETRFVFPARAVTDPDDPGLAAAFAEFGRACRGVASVRGAVYGQFGPRPANFETCAFDELSLLRKLGARVVPVPLTTLFARAAQVPEKAIRAAYADMEGCADREGVDDMDLAKMARLEVALDEMVREHGLDGLALQCWTSIQQDYGISPCFVMARLTDRGVPSACEVDVHGTLSMHLLAAVAGVPAALADWNNRHVAEPDVFSAWHCGVFPPSMAEGGCSLSYHNILAEDTGYSEGKHGTLELSLKRGPVTLARVTEHPWDTWPLLVAEGEVVEAEGEPYGGNGWVRVSDLDALYAEILRGFPHHAAIAHGEHAAALLTAAYFLGLEPVVPLETVRGHLVTGPEY